MLCPECQAEYREGFYECSECQVPLVAELPPGTEHPQDPELDPEPDLELVTVLETGSPDTITGALSVLQNAGMYYLVRRDEGTNPFAGFVVRPTYIQVCEERMNLRQESCCNNTWRKKAGSRGGHGWGILFGVGLCWR